MNANQFRRAAAKVIAGPIFGNETIDHLLARLRHCGPEGERLRREYLEPAIREDAHALNTMLSKRTKGVPQ